MVEVVSGDNRSCYTCKAPVKSSPTTNQLFYRLDALPVTQLTAPVVTVTSITISSNKIQNGDILVQANPGPPGKR